MPDELESGQIAEWQAASITFLMAVVIAAIAWAVIDPEGVGIAADAAAQFWIKLRELQFVP